MSVVLRSESLQNLRNVVWLVLQGELRCGDQGLGAGSCGDVADGRRDVHGDDRRQLRRHQPQGPGRHLLRLHLRAGGRLDLLGDGKSWVIWQPFSLRDYDQHNHHHDLHDLHHHRHHHRLDLGSLGCVQ